MKIEAGRRYRLYRIGLKPLDGVAVVDQNGALVFRPDGEARAYMVDETGKAPGVGRLIDMDFVEPRSESPANLPPSDGGLNELDELRRRFENWDFSYGARG